MKDEINGNTDDFTAGQHRMKLYAFRLFRRGKMFFALLQATTEDRCLMKRLMKTI
jgi:hypothetical protein